MLELKHNERYLIEEGTLLAKALKVLKEYPNGVFRNPLGNVYRYGSSDTPIPDESEFEIDIEESIRETIFSIKEEIDCPTFGIKRTDNSVLVEWDWDGEEYLEGNEYYIDPSDEKYQLEVPTNYVDVVVRQLTMVFPEGMSYNLREKDIIRLHNGTSVDNLENIKDPKTNKILIPVLSSLKFLAKNLCVRTDIDYFEIVATENEYIFRSSHGFINYTKEFSNGTSS